MARGIKRTPSIRDYSSIKGKRRLEVFGFILSAVLIVVGTVSYLISKRLQLLNSNVTTSSSNSSNEYVDYISESEFVDGNVTSFCSNRSIEYMVDITGSEFVDITGNESVNGIDGIVYPPGTYWISDNGTTWGCPCMLKFCIQKCCKKEKTHLISDYVIDKVTYKMKDCINNEVSFHPKNLKVHSIKNDSLLERVAVKDDHFFIISGAGENKEKYDLSVDEQEDVFLLENGSIFWNSSNLLQSYNDFCVESSIESPDIYIMIFFSDDPMESTEAENEWMFFVKGTGLIISLPFLFVTLVVYALLPQLHQNLHGKSLMCHVSSLTVAYSTLALTQVVSNELSPIVCTSIAFVTQFTVLTSFFWLNAMCFDIWWVFSGLMPLRGSQKDAEQLKFMLYSLYAWGCPLIILAVTLIMDFTPGISNIIIRPEMGITKCFFKEKDARLLYLYLPIGVLLYLNTVMFLTTALRFKSHSKSVKKLERGDSRRHCQASKSSTEVQRFQLYLKLFLVMGLNWLLEIVSFLVDSDSYVWLFIDLFNALQGIVFFYMFVWKRRILRQLNLKLCPNLDIITTEHSKTNFSGRSNSTVSRSTVRCKLSNATEYQCTIASGDSSA